MVKSGIDETASLDFLLIDDTIDYFYIFWLNI